MRSETVKKLVAVALCISVVAAAHAAERIIYVDAAATEVNDGSSWTDAYVSLQDALTVAKEVDKPLEIRVAQGTYVSRRPMGFEPPAGAVLKGGYAGTAATEPNDRDIVDYATILTGNRVIAVHDIASSVVISGFTITYGPSDTGGHIQNASPTFVDCRFLSDGIMRFGIEAWDSNCVLIRCQFEGNSGCGIACYGGHLTLTDCTFAQVQSEAISGSGTIYMLRCSFVDNGQAVDWGGTLTARHCTFAGNHADSFAPVSCSGDSTFSDCHFINNTSTGEPTGPGALTVYGDTATLTRCLFAGNSASARASGALESHVSVLKLSHCLFVGNKGGESRPGAIYHLGHQVLILRASNCTFAGNRGQPNTIAYSGPRARFNAIVELSQCIVQDGPDPFSREPAVTYSNVEGGYEGQGNIDVDPSFVAPGYWDPNGTPDDPNDDVWIMGDYHLKSQAGHWDSETESWVLDEVTSPCIDVGDPNGPLGAEPFPNGGFVNLGAYGGTIEASRSYFGAPVCETQIAGDINGDCKVDDLDLDILTSHWLMDATEAANIPPTIRIVSPEDGAELTEPAPIIFRVEASDPDGTILQGEYHVEYKGDAVGFTKLIPISEPFEDWTYELNWSLIHYDGALVIRAKAIDNDGAIVVSEPITITLHPSPENQ